jgi:SpoIID/LytB domain protein
MCTGISPVQNLFLSSTFLLLVALSNVAPAEALPSNLRVRLFEAHGRIESVQIRGPFNISEPGQKRILRNEWIRLSAKNRQIEMFSHGNSRQPFLTGQRLTIEPLDRRGVRIRINRDNIERAYLGRLSFSVGETARLPSLRIVNEVPTIEYVASVVGSESPLRSPPEAIKALAVLVIAIVEQKGERSLVGDSTKEQAYKGCDHATPAIFSAVKAVYGKRLFFRKNPVQAFFHSTCAGGTSRGSDIFGINAKPLEYLESVSCEYCKESPFWKTKVSSLPLSTMNRAFGGRLSATKYDAQDRPTIVQVLDGASVGKEMSGYEAWLKLGRTYGWGKVPGTRYQFRDNNENVVDVESSGAGHGVGYCQWGGVGLAKQGKKYDEILKFYFPRCSVRSISAGARR